MKIPKIVKQVGNVGAYKRVFIEEYVLAYMTSLEKSDSDFEDDLALYGEHTEEHGNPVDMVYGCVRLETRLRLDSAISESDRILMNELRKQYFLKYDVIGVVRVQPKRERKIFLIEGSKYIPLPGYYMFFDKNDGMQEYMVEQKKQNDRIQIAPSRIEKTVTASAKGTNKPSAWKTYLTWALLLLLGCYAVYRSVENYNKGEESRLLDTITEANPKPLDESNENLLLSMAEENSKNVITILDEGEKESVNTVSTNSVKETQPSSSSAESISENSVIRDIWNQEKKEAPEEQPIESVDTSGTSIAAEPEAEEAVSPSPEPVTVLEPEYDKYVIKQGDSLILICRARYGSEQLVDEICTVNNIKDPDSIYEGQTILLPVK